MKPISSIKIGDLVLSPRNHSEPVIIKLTHEDENALVSLLKIDFKNEETGETGEMMLTPDHYIFLKEYSEAVPAKMANPGNHLLSSLGSSLTILTSTPVLAPSSDLVHFYTPSNTFLLGPHSVLASCKSANDLSEWHVPLSAFVFNQVS